MPVSRQQARSTDPHWGATPMPRARKHAFRKRPELYRAELERLEDSFEPWKRSVLANQGRCSRLLARILWRREPCCLRAPLYGGLRQLELRWISRNYLRPTSERDDKAGRTDLFVSESQFRL